MTLRKYKNINFPINPIFVQTPESFVSNASGLITSWVDESGNNNHSLPITGTLGTSNQNGLQGLLPLASSSMRRSITLNPQQGTTAILVQRNCDLKTIPGTNYLIYFGNLSAVIVNTIYAVDSQYGINYAGSTITTAAYSGIGKYLFVIIRHNAGAVNYFINNTTTNSTIVKTSTPSYISEQYDFYDVNNTGSQAGYIQNFKAYWNRELTDAECLQLSQYVFMMSNGAVGDNPNTLTKYKEIDLPENALYIRTPDSIVTSSAGTVNAWNDVVNSNHITSFSGTLRKSNQNSLAGIQFATSSQCSKQITANLTSFTTAILVQRNCNFPTIGANVYLNLIQNISLSFTSILYTNNTQIGFAYQGSTGTLITNPSAGLGNYLFIITRYNDGFVDYFVNNVSVNGTCVRTGSPNAINEAYNIYPRLSTANSSAWINNLDCMWNRVLTNDECLKISNYAYAITNGQIGDKPLNQALLSKKQLELGAL